MKFRNPWDSEFEIATATREALESLGWEVHPECGGWDLLAVAMDVRAPWYGDLRPGDVLGVECKLDAGTLSGLESLLRQTLWMPIKDCQVAMRWEGSRDRYAEPPVIDFIRPRSGPHFRALVSARIAAAEVWRGMGVLAIDVAVKTWDKEGWKAVPSGWRRETVAEIAERFRSAGWGANTMPRRQPQHPPKVPRVVVDVPAGVPSPQTSSPWKVAAVEVMLKLRAGELMTSAEIQAMGINPRRLIDSYHLVDSGERRGRAYLWKAGEPDAAQIERFGREAMPPDLRWPEIAEALRRKGAAA